MPGCKLRAPEKQLSCRRSNIFQKQFNFNIITLNTLPWTLQVMDLGLDKQSRNPELIYRVFLFSFSFPRYFRETANAMFCFNFDQNHFVCRRNFVLVFCRPLENFQVLKTLHYLTTQPTFICS